MGRSRKAVKERKKQRHAHKESGRHCRHHKRHHRSHRSSSRMTRSHTPPDQPPPMPMVQPSLMLGATPQQPREPATPSLPPLSSLSTAQVEVSDRRTSVISVSDNRSVRSDSVPSATPHVQPELYTPSNQPSNVLLNLKDIAHLIEMYTKPNWSANFNNTTIIPEFDPALKSNRIDQWILKVNECAKMYKWDEAHTIHYALPKLVGRAKEWYQGQATILHTWPEWQMLLRKAFPTDTNYGVLLTEMLQKRLKQGENLDIYFIEKIVLLNSCNISGKKAVDCIILGIDDRTIRAGASSARFTEPEDLLKYLKDVCTENAAINKTRNVLEGGNVNNESHKDIQTATNSVQIPYSCFNCGDKGHRVQQCHKPIVNCTICKRIGHTDDKCKFKKSK